LELASGRVYSEYSLSDLMHVLRMMSRAHSFPRQNLTNSAANLVNSAAHRGKADEKYVVYHPSDVNAYIVLLGCL